MARPAEEARGLAFARGRRSVPPPDSRAIVAVLAVSLALVLVRLWTTPSVPEGVLVEVRGEVPRPGSYVLAEPTVHAALASAGGAPVGPDGPVSFGDRVVVEGGAVRVLPPSDPLLVGLPIDLDRCDAAALSAVPGISPELAAAIVAERDANGPFRKLSDLRRVPELGPGLVERLRPFVALADGPVDVNTAPASVLEGLPGIGPVLAARIVVERHERGPFADMDALTRVRGIDAALLDRLRTHVTVSAP